MRWKDVDLNPKTRVLRQFGGIAATLCALMAVRNFLLTQQFVLAMWWCAAAVAFVLLSLVRPNWLRGLFVAGIVATFPIGWVVSHVILLILFFGLMTPLALVFRWTGRDLLNVQPSSRDELSFWSPKSVNLDKRSYFRQF